MLSWLANINPWFSRAEAKRKCFGQHEEAVNIAVQGTIKGIDPNATDRIFDSLPTTKTHGLGMGLSISCSILEADGGPLRALYLLRRLLTQLRHIAGGYL
jgi:phosphoglycerate-specific signal transduction histidine kinase